jgi:hypothetical protein
MNQEIIVQRPSFLSGRHSQEDILKLLDSLKSWLRALIHFSVRHGDSISKNSIC